MYSLAEKNISSTRLLHYLIGFAQLYSQGCSFFNLSLPASLEKHRARLPWRMTTSTVHLLGCYWDITAKKLNKVPHRKKNNPGFQHCKSTQH